MTPPSSLKAKPPGGGNGVGLADGFTPVGAGGGVGKPLCVPIGRGEGNDGTVGNGVAVRGTGVGLEKTSVGIWTTKAVDVGRGVVVPPTMVGAGTVRAPARVGVADPAAPMTMIGSEAFRIAETAAYTPAQTIAKTTNNTIVVPLFCM